MHIAHFCFSELLILREKKIRGIFFGPLEYQKKITNFQKILKKTPYRRVAQKKAPQITLFFYSPCIYIYECHVLLYR